MPRTGIEPVTRGFSVLCSTNWAIWANQIFASQQWLFYIKTDKLSIPFEKKNFLFQFLFSYNEHINIPSFYSHASYEAWPQTARAINCDFEFLPTCLLRGMTRYTLFTSPLSQFLLTCLLRGMTTFFHPLPNSHQFLLICLLRGMTYASGRFCFQYFGFYLHASCEAWRYRKCIPQRTGCFYSHASYEAWQIPWWTVPRIRGFYSHVSCEAWLQLLTN